MAKMSLIYMAQLQLKRLRVLKFKRPVAGERLRSRLLAQTLCWGGRPLGPQQLINYALSRIIGD